MAMQPTKIGGVSGYITRRLPPRLRFLSKEATEHAVHSTARNGTHSHISGKRGYESNRVHSLSIFHSYCKYGNQFNHAVLWRGTTRNQDSCGIRPRGVNRVHQAQGEPWGSPVAWVSSRKWYLASIQLWKDQAKRGLNNVGQVNLKRLLFKQKGLWPARPGHLGMPHKCLKWTPHWTMPKTRRCLWCNGL